MHSSIFLTVLNVGDSVEIPLKDLTVEDKSGYPGLAALVIYFDYDQTLTESETSDNAIAFLTNFTTKMSFGMETSIYLPSFYIKMKQ